MKLGRYWVIKPYEAFGNRAEDLYYALLKCRREHLKLIILKRKWNLFGKLSFRKANAQLLNIQHPLIVNNVFLEGTNYLLTIVLSMIRVIGIGTRKLFTILGTGWTQNWLVSLSEFCIGRDELWGRATIPFSLHSRVMNYETATDERLNVSFKERKVLDATFPFLQGKKYACLHVRSGGFFDDHEYSAPRNSDISSYVPAINYLVNEGFIVVRVGDPSMPHLDIAGVFDYAHSDARSELNDVMLIEHCEFYIGSLAGPIDLACLFEKRILTVNCLSLSHCTWYQAGSLFIPKKPVLDGRVLALREQIDHQLFEVTGTGRMNPRVTYLENTAAEILDATEEFLVSNELLQDQVEFNQYLYQSLLKYFQSTPVWENQKDDAYSKARWISRFNKVKGSVSARYLARNWQ